MPLKEEKKLIREIEREYRKKGFSLARSKHITNATVFGKHLVKHHHSKHAKRNKYGVPTLYTK